MTPDMIMIESLVHAPLETVWFYWTDPMHMVQWNVASDDWCCPKVENHLVVGGRYKARMEAKDGSDGFDLEAIYDEVIHLQSIVYTMTDGRVVKNFFQAQHGTTKMTMYFVPELENSISLQRQGWQAILNHFKSYVEQESKTVE